MSSYNYLIMKLDSFGQNLALGSKRAFQAGGFNHITKNVLVKQGEKLTTFYLPGYMRFKVKNINSISLDNLEADVNGTLIFTVYYGELNLLGKGIVEELMSSIVLQLETDKAFLLKKSIQISLSHSEAESTFTFTVRKKVTVGLVGYLYWSPFESMDLVLSIKASGCTLEQPINGKKVNIRFNLLDHPQPLQKLSTTINNTTFGCYKLAENKLRATYTDTRDPLFQAQYELQPDRSSSLDLSRSVLIKNEAEDLFRKQKHSSSFEFAHFQIRMYKNPFVSASTIFCPLWFLGILNLSIFYQNSDLASRVASLASLMIAFVALMPTIRSQIPPSPNILYVEILVYMELLASLICLGQSVYNRNETNFVFDYNSDPFFLVALALNLYTFISILVLSLVHILYWRSSYHIENYKEYKGKFEREMWTNQACEANFKDNPEIKLFKFNETENVKVELLEPVAIKAEKKDSIKTKDRL